MNEEEDLIKRNFKRFMRMVEQKKQAVEAAVKEQERIMREQKRLRPAGEDRDQIEPAEACFEMLKKRKTS